MKVVANDPMDLIVHDQSSLKTAIALHVAQQAHHSMNQTEIDEVQSNTTFDTSTSENMDFEVDNTSANQDSPIRHIEKSQDAQVSVAFSEVEVSSLLRLKLIIWVVYCPLSSIYLLLLD